MIVLKAFAVFSLLSSLSSAHIMYGQPHWKILKDRTNRVSIVTALSTHLSVV